MSGEPENFTRWPPAVAEGGGGDGLQARSAGDRLGSLRDDRRRLRPRSVGARDRDVLQARLKARSSSQRSIRRAGALSGKVRRQVMLGSFIGPPLIGLRDRLTAEIDV